MEVIQCEIPEVKIINPKMWPDDRGYFFESYNERVFSSLVKPCTFIQDNQSLSKKHTFRGLHYQLPPFAQSKLVRVTLGQVLDIAVDIRKGSPTFGHSVVVELSEQNHKQLFIPRGFAHGFLVLSEQAIFQYKVDNTYSKNHDRGINLKDPSLNLSLPPLDDQFVLSEKDKNLPFLKDAELFEYGIDLYK